MGTTTYDVGVIPEDSQLLSVTIRVAVVSNAAGTATVSVGKTGTTQYFIANTNVKSLGETSSIANGALDESDRFNTDTAATGQITVTFTYLQANNLQDKAANT